MTVFNKKQNWIISHIKVQGWMSSDAIGFDYAEANDFSTSGNVGSLVKDECLVLVDAGVMAKNTMGQFNLAN